MYTFLTNTNQISTNTTSFFGVVFQLINIILVLVFTIALIYGLAYLAKKMRIGNGGINSRNINIIEYRAIANNSSLVLTKVGKKYLLLGVSKETTRLICEIEEDELDFEEIKNQTSFKEIFNSKFKNAKDENGGDKFEQF